LTEESFGRHESASAAVLASSEGHAKKTHAGAKSKSDKASAKAHKKVEDLAK
jgi:hypothetical protein